VFNNLYQKIKYSTFFENLKGLHEKGAKLFIINYDDILKKFYDLFCINQSNKDDVFKFRYRNLNGIFRVYKSYLNSDEIILNTTYYYQIK
jgi:hypothetical protein